MIEEIFFSIGIVAYLQNTKTMLAIID